MPSPTSALRDVSGRWSRAARHLSERRSVLSIEGPPLGNVSEVIEPLEPAASDFCSSAGSGSTGRQSGDRSEYGKSDSSSSSDYPADADEASVEAAFASVERALESGSRSTPRSCPYGCQCVHVAGGMRAVAY